MPTPRSAHAPAARRRPPGTGGSAPERAHRRQQGNLRVLGVLTLVLLGGLATYLALRPSGNVINNRSNIVNQVIHNEFFTALVASGAASLRDLESLADVRPFEDGFVGVTSDRLTWGEANALAGRSGSRILDVSGADRATGTRVDWLSGQLTAELTEPAWIRKEGEARVLDYPDILPLANFTRPRRVLLHWIRNGNPASELVIPPWRTVWFKSSADPINQPEAWRRLAVSPAAVAVTAPTVDFTFGWGKGPADLNLSPALNAADLGDDAFGMIATTRARIPAGKWRLRVKGDDGFRLLADGRALLEKWSGSFGDLSAELDQRTAGDVELVLEYFEIAAMGEISLRIEISAAGAVPAAATVPAPAVLPERGRAEAIARIRQLGGRFEEGPENLGRPIRRIDLAMTKADPAALRLFQGLPYLDSIDLNGCAMGDAGLLELGQMPGLKVLSFWGSGPVTDSGFQHLGTLVNLRILNIGYTGLESIAGSGLTHLTPLKRLTNLGLNWLPKLRDENLAYLSPMVDLEWLGLGYCVLISDAGMPHLSSLTNLRELDLRKTLVTDEGLRKLHGLKKLEKLHLEESKVSAAGIAELLAVNPGIKVQR